MRARLLFTLNRHVFGVYLAAVGALAIGLATPPSACAQSSGTEPLLRFRRGTESAPTADQAATAAQSSMSAPTRHEPLPTNTIVKGPNSHEVAPTQFYRDDQLQQANVRTTDPPSAPTAAVDGRVSGARPGPASDNRKLAPSAVRLGASDATRTPLAAPSFGQFRFPAVNSLSTAAAGLGIVVGLFLVCMWLLRGNRSQASGELPAEAFAVLGRAVLAGRHSAHLVRLGNKLVLVSITPDGVQPLAEVNELAEVDRISGLCVSSQSHGPSAEFREVLTQLAQEPAKGFLGKSTRR